MKKLASGGPISSHNVQFDQKQFWRFCHEKVISTLNRLKHFYFQWSGCGIVDRAVASTPEDPGSNPAVGNYSKKRVFAVNCYKHKMRFTGLSSIAIIIISLRYILLSMGVQLFIEEQLLLPSVSSSGDL